MAECDTCANYTYDEEYEEGYEEGYEEENAGDGEFIDGNE